MKVSGFTFLRNGQKLGYPFVESIRSVLPIVDEFVVALGPCDDDTERMLRTIGNPKIRIIPTQWNERTKNDYSIKGFVYGQQKSIALFNCTGDWAFYLEGDEIIHESELAKIRASMEQHLDDPRIEALGGTVLLNARVGAPFQRGWHFIFRTGPMLNERGLRR